MSDIKLKHGAVLSFVDGLLEVNDNGDGRISFKEDDLEWADGTDHWRFARLKKSELESIRDFLNKWLPPA